MKKMRATASAIVPASAAECVALLAAVDEYPAWHPEVIRDAKVLVRDESGLASSVLARLRVSRGPFRRDLELTLIVRLQLPGTVELKRVREGPEDEEEFRAVWCIEDGPPTRIELALDGYLDVPRPVPLGGLAAELAQGFVAAAGRALARPDRPRWALD